jgi:hypothetical protein
MEGRCCLPGPQLWPASRGGQSNFFTLSGQNRRNHWEFPAGTREVFASTGACQRIDKNMKKWLYRFTDKHTLLSFIRQSH